MSQTHFAPKEKGEKMARYIDFEIAREYLHKACEGLGSNGGLMLKIKFDEEPTADVVPVVHGEWVVNKDGSFSCSVCKFNFYPLSFEYCPHCGAKMDADVIRYLEFLDKLKSCGADMRGGADEKVK